MPVTRSGIAAPTVTGGISAKALAGSMSDDGRLVIASDQDGGAVEVGVDGAVNTTITQSSATAPPF